MPDHLKPKELLSATKHRPWPLPESRWVMRMSWEKLAFLHWQVPTDPLQRHLPDGVELDLFEGHAWLGVVPFLMTGVGLRGFPNVPGTDRFPELNLRTYVKCNGRAGVWFFSLDAGSRLAVRLARWRFHLPYFDARMRIDSGERTCYTSERTHRGAVAGRLEAEYRPISAVTAAQPGTVEHWLTERYCLFSCDANGQIWRGEIHHCPWPLQSAVASIRENTLGALISVKLNRAPSLVHYAERLDVVAWPLIPA